jgi:multidrug efflux pump subunit AcrA (membrane-fusion protein)
MSSPNQRIDPNLVEQTKQQIRALVGEISKISKTDIAPEDFHKEFLSRVVVALAAEAGAIWSINAVGQLALSYQINIQKTRLHEDEEANKKHSRLLYQFLRSDENEAIVLPNSGGEAEDSPGNPTNYLVLFGKIRTELEAFGLIEIFQRPDASPTTQKGYLRFVSQMTDIAGEFYKSRQLRSFGDRQSLWTQLEDFTRNIHKTLDMRETEYVVANESRRLIECDRVSIAIKRGRKCRIEAVSGQDIVNKRSNAITLLGKLATAVIAADEPVFYMGDTTDLAPQVEEAIEDYVDESHTKMIAVFPLRRKNVNEGDSEETEQNKTPKEPPFGAIIIEQIEDNRVPDRMKKRMDVVVEHAQSAVGNALDHNSVFLMPLWRTIGKSKVLVTARMLPKTIAVAVALLVLILALVFNPWNFNMYCSGTLEPEVRRNIFAREDGKVDQVLVHHGQKVEEGEVLLRMTNNELEAETKKIGGDLAEVIKQIASATEMAYKTSGERGREGDSVQIQGEIARLEIRRNALKVQEEILWERYKDMEVRSPIAGTVMTFDLSDRLRSRPVQKGQCLLEVAQPEGNLILELDMPEKKMGHVSEYLKKLQAEDPDAELDVSFVMTVDSTKSFKGKIYEIHDRAGNKGDKGTVVEMKAKIDNPETLPESKRAGAAVSAKIYCGKKSLGYVLFNEAIAYLQKTVFFWFK